MQKHGEPSRARDLEQMRRSRLLRDVIVFQGKLLLDAFKDVLLGPLSLFATVVDMIRPRPRSQLLFYRLLAQGKAAERAIDLFSVIDGGRAGDDHWTVDAVIEQVEMRLAGSGEPRGPDDEDGDSTRRSGSQTGDRE